MFYNIYSKPPLFQEAFFKEKLMKKIKAGIIGSTGYSGA
jgi:hypothetical protein